MAISKRNDSAFIHDFEDKDTVIRALWYSQHREVHKWPAISCYATLTHNYRHHELHAPQDNLGYCEILGQLTRVTFVRILEQSQS